MAAKKQKNTKTTIREINIIEITQCSFKYSWYKNKIGSKFIVDNFAEDTQEELGRIELEALVLPAKLDEEEWFLILKCDCKILKTYYETDNLINITEFIDLIDIHNHPKNTPRQAKSK